jgi:putative phosphoesterase
MKIGLISDTHSYLDPKVFIHFANVDEIWHAGDIGDLNVSDALRNFKPLRAVFGNIDDIKIQTQFPEDLHFDCQGMQIWMTHIGGAPPNYNPRIKKELSRHVPDVFICGHSHILRIKRDEKYQNMLYVNPGAAGNHGFHVVKTLVRFDIAEKQIFNLEVIEIGKRGAI